MEAKQKLGTLGSSNFDGHESHGIAPIVSIKVHYPKEIHKVTIAI